MKTANFFFALAFVSLALISCQKETIVPQQPITEVAAGSAAGEIVADDAALKGNAVISVRYIVSVHLDIDKSLCNRYLVEITDGVGNVIATENFTPEKSAYTFYEQVRTASGIRMARLVQVVWPEHFVCDTELFTKADIHMLNFAEGSSYDFDLYPNTSRTKAVE